jgi:hypothetical protein
MARPESTTGDAFRDHRRLQRNALIERERLSSCMNTTKWDEIVPIMQWGLAMRVRMIDDPPGEPLPDPRDTWESLGNASWIEWLEFCPVRTVQRRGLLDPEIVGDETEHLLTVLRAINAPTSIEDGWIRVWGYLRPGTAPSWIIPAPKA